MASYANSCIYTIRSPHTDKYYIGSTRTPLRKRLWEHKRSYNAWCKDNTKLYYTSFEVLKYGDAYIELLEEYPCENVQQLYKKEGEHIRSCKADIVNHNVAGRTEKEWAKEYDQTPVRKEARRQRASTEEYKAYQKAYRARRKEEKESMCEKTD